MAKYSCPKCSYKTDKKDHYNDHLNRKIPCDTQPTHNNVKGIKLHKCPECDKTFSRADSLKRHCKTYHTVINGNKNTVNYIDNQTNIQTQNNIKTKKYINTQQINPIVINPIIYKYNHNDINDLTLFEQFRSLTSNSPYTTLLDFYNLNPNKPKYHNMSYTNINKNTMNVHDGEKWIKEIVASALSNVVDSHRLTILMIFFRFRIFLSAKATYLIPDAYYFGAKNIATLYFHKKIIKNIKLHLYNNRKSQIQHDENIPDDNDPIFWALSKQFTWDETESLINKMDDLNISFDNDLPVIKKDILHYVENDSKLKKFFKKLINHIDFLIDDFEKSKKLSKNEIMKYPQSSPEYSPVDSDE